MSVHAGQGCALTTRLLVPRDRYDEAVDIAAATMASLGAQDPADPGTVCGPLISTAQRDRVAGYLPNVPEALVALLATASLGAIWTSCAPEFGVRSVVYRLSQVEPTVLLTIDGDVKRTLARQDLTLRSAPPAGTRVVLKTVVNENAANIRNTVNRYRAIGETNLARSPSI